jgi:hypothetical protein
VYDPGPRWSAAFRDGPWATLLPLLSLLPFMLSGAVRYAYGSSFVVALALPSALSVIAAGLVYVYGLPRIEQAHSRVAALATFGLTLLAVGLTFELWWTPLFAGLPNTFEGVDIGNHLLIYQRFVRPGGHRQYAGFVTLYALMHWYRVLFDSQPAPGPSYWYALRFAHYACLLVLPVSIALVVYPVLARVRGAIQTSVVAVFCMPVVLGALGLLCFPVVQYYQAEGFYSQIIGLYPLLFGWLCYGLIEHAGARFLLCCFWLVVQRFSYGLNMADTLFALAYLWLWDARSIRWPLVRWGAWAFVPAACWVAARILRQLLVLRYAKGYFIEYLDGWVLLSMPLLALLLMLAPSLLRQRGIAVAPASERLWRYAGSHGLVTTLLLLLYVAAGGPRMYYFQKYTLYSSLLLAVASVGPVCTLLAHLLTTGWAWMWRLERAQFLFGAALLAALALGAAAQGYRAYWALASERWHRSTPSAGMYATWEPEVDDFIAKTLADKKAAFGGYYDPFWPRMFTQNTFYFFFSHARDHIFNGDFLAGAQMFGEDPGHCLFMAGSPEDYAPGASSDMGKQLRRLHGARGLCHTFQPAWSAAPRTVCATCLEPSQDAKKP